MNQLKLLPGPQLWFKCYPMKKARDVTAHAHMFLHENVTLDPEITLGDILKLFEAAPLLLENYHLSFSKALVEEASKGYLKPKREPKSEKLEYLEMYARWSLNTHTNEFSSPGDLDLHGVGPLLKRNAPMYDKKKGERVEFSLSFSPVRSLLNLPVRVNPKVNVLEDDIDSHRFYEIITSYTVTGNTLGSVLQGILSALTFHGTPQDTVKVSAEIKESVDKLKADNTHGTVQGIDAEDIFAEWDRAGMDLMFESTGEHRSRDITWCLRNIPNEENACLRLESELPGVIVKAAYREINAHTFRKTFREAKASRKSIAAKKK